MSNISQTCTKCKRNFLVIEQEQKFLKDKNLPLPTMCPGCRQSKRLMLRGERTLYKTKCHKCQQEIIVSYDPKTMPNPILCKKDYEEYFDQNDPIINEPLPEDE